MEGNTYDPAGNHARGDAGFAASCAVAAFQENRILLGFQLARLALEAERCANKQGLPRADASWGAPAAVPIHDDMVNNTSGWMTPNPGPDVVVPVEEPAVPITPPPTSRCTTVLMQAGSVPGECHQAIAWDDRNNRWYHVDPKHDGHPIEPRARQEQQ